MDAASETNRVDGRGGMGPAAAVMAGWYALTVAVYLVAFVTSSGTRPDPCVGICPSERERLFFGGLILGVPALLAAVVVSVLLLRRTGRRPGRGPLATGTLAASPAFLLLAVALAVAVQSTLH